MLLGPSPAGHLGTAAHAARHPSPQLVTQPDPAVERLTADLKEALPDLVRAWTAHLDEVA